MADSTQELIFKLVIDGKEATAFLDSIKGQFVETGEAGGQTNERIKQSYQNLTVAQQNLLSGQQHMNDAVMKFGTAISDAGLFMDNTRAGMTALTQNLSSIVQGFIQAKQAAGGQVTMMQLLTKSIMGGGGLNIGINSLMLALDVLPNLFSGTTVKITELNNTMGEEEKKLRIQQIEFNSLIGVLDESTFSEEARKGALEKLKKEYPDYVKNLKDEKEGHQKISEALKLGNEQFEKKIQLAAGERILKEYYDQASEKQYEIQKNEEEIKKLEAEKEKLDKEKTVWNEVTKKREKDVWAITGLEARIEYLKGSNKELEKEQNTAIAKVDEFNLKLSEISSGIIDKEKGSTGDKGGTGDNLFRRQEAELKESHRHVEALLKLQTDNDDLMLLLKTKHFDEMIALYKQFGKDTTNLENQRIEAGAQLTAGMEKIAPKGIAVIEEKKIKIYEQSNDEIEKRNRDHQRRIQKLTELTTNEKLGLLMTEKDAVADSLGQISGMFAQHTLAYQAFAKAQALIDTYTAAEAAYKAVVGIPIVGPGLAIAAAIAATLAGLARVEQIGKVEIPKGKGFEAGGRLPQGKMGYFEGTANEVIAPEQDFKTYSAELVRQALIESRNYISVSSSASSSNELIAIRRELTDLKQAIIERPSRAYLDDREAKKIYNSGSRQNRRGKI